MNREQVLSGMFGDRNAQWMMNTLIGKSGQFERDRALVDSGLSGYDTYQKLLKSNPQLAQQALHSQWENVQARLGYEILPRLIPYMIKFADGLDGVAQWMEKHGTATTAIALGLGAIGIGLSLIGKVLMTAGIIKFLGLGPVITGVLSKVGGGIMGFIRVISSGIGIALRGVLFLGRALLMNPIGLVITAIAAAAYLLWKNWDYVGPKLKAAWDSIKSAVGALSDWMRAKWEWIKSYLPSSWFGGSDSNSSTAQRTASGKIGGSPYLAPASQPAVNVQVFAEMDGENITKKVTVRQTRNLSRPPTGGSSYDGSMSPMPVGAGATGGW